MCERIAPANTYFYGILFSGLLGGCVASTSLAQTPPAAVPPPVAQSLTDCSRPQYASDTLVCADPVLRALDTEVAGLSLTIPPLAAAAIWEEQGAWIRRRSLCAFRDDHRACLAAAYEDRQAGLMAATQPSPVAVSCDSIWRGRDLSISAPSPGKSMTIRTRAGLVAVASTASTQWQPWLLWRQSGRHIEFVPQDGPRITCRLRTDLG